MEEIAKPAVTPQQAKFTDSKRSSFALYRELVTGQATLPYFLWYELNVFFISGVAGLAGLGLRSALYPSLFKTCGRRPAIGRGVVLRQPNKISVGNKLLLDDYSVLDARGESSAIEIGNFVSIGRFTTITAKSGKIVLADGANIGSYCRIATQSSVTIGESALIAAYCYIGPGNHVPGDASTPLISRDMEIKGGVKIGAQAWIGAGAIIMDGVTIGERAIVGAQSLVRENVPDGAVVAGTPARIIG